MYKKLFIVTAGSLALIACSSTPEKSTSEDISTSSTQAAICEPVQSMMGNWQPADITPETKQAAVLASVSMSGDHSLEEILSVDQQDATETNYRINFVVEDGEIYTSTVFRSPNGEYKLLAVQPKSLVDQCNNDSDA